MLIAYLLIRCDSEELKIDNAHWCFLNKNDLIWFWKEKTDEINSIILASGQKTVRTELLSFDKTSYMAI